MRLLNAHTHILSEFNETNTPRYAILSHTWGDDEILFQDAASLPRLRSTDISTRAGYLKVWSFMHCAQAAGFEWVWIDTLCIDKSNSAELSETINSMYRWYESAECCYVHLCDVSVPSLDLPNLPEDWDFPETCRWCTRGWTLQELIAPREVKFFSQNWVEMGTKRSLRKFLERRTRIPEELLNGEWTPEDYSIATRMSWASERQTTRSEDVAYCLMGLFDVNMPLLYGEGMKAFIRLQEEIMKNSDDQSLFAWASKLPESRQLSGLLAVSPAAFQYSANAPYPEFQSTSSVPYGMTNKGLCIQLRTLDLEEMNPNLPLVIAALACRQDGDYHHYIGLLLLRTSAPGAAQFARAMPEDIFLMSAESVEGMKPSTIYVRQKVVLPAFKGTMWYRRFEDDVWKLTSSLAKKGMHLVRQSSHIIH